MTQSIYRFSIPFQVALWDAGPTGRMTPPAVLRYMEEVASRHCLVPGTFFGQVGTKACFWVMTGMNVAFYEMPKVTEPFTIETWHAGCDRICFYRAYRLVGANGRKIAQGVTSWAVVDAGTRRMIRAASVPVEVPSAESHELDHLRPVRLTPQTIASPGTPWTVGYRDLDVNRHMNHIRYAELFLESISEQVWKERLLRSLQMEFRSEVRYKETMNTHMLEDADSGTFHHLMVRGDGKTACLGKTVWANGS